MKKKKKEGGAQHFFFYFFIFIFKINPFKNIQEIGTTTIQAAASNAQTSDLSSLSSDDVHVIIRAISSEATCCAASEMAAGTDSICQWIRFSK